MWVYQFGYLDGDRPVWINPLWFWECHPDVPQGSPGRAPRASGLPKYPAARPRQDAPQRPRTARINVRFAPKATEVLRCRKASLCATSGHSITFRRTPVALFSRIAVAGIRHRERKQFQAAAIMHAHGPSRPVLLEKAGTV